MNKPKRSLPRQFHFRDNASTPEGLRSLLPPLRDIEVPHEIYAPETFRSLRLLGQITRGATSLIASKYTDQRAPFWEYDAEKSSLIYQRPHALSWTLGDRIPYYRRVTIMAARAGEGGIFTILQEDVHAPTHQAISSLAVGLAIPYRIGSIKSEEDLGIVKHIGYLQTRYGDHLPDTSILGVITTSEITLGWVKPYDRTYKKPLGPNSMPDQRPDITLYYLKATGAVTMLANLALTSTEA